MVPVFLGGLLRGFLVRRAKNEEEATARRDRGVLFGSGLVGGEGLIGVVIAGFAGWAASRGAEPFRIGTGWAGGHWPEIAAAAAFALLIFYFWRLVVRPDTDAA
jgi:hypothetical protein